MRLCAALEEVFFGLAHKAGDQLFFGIQGGGGAIRLVPAQAGRISDRGRGLYELAEAVEPSLFRAGGAVVIDGGRDDLSGLQSGIKLGFNHSLVVISLAGCQRLLSVGRTGQNLVVVLAWDELVQAWLLVVASGGGGLQLVDGGYGLFIGGCGVQSEGYRECEGSANLGVSVCS